MYIFFDASCSYIRCMFGVFYFFVYECKLALGEWPVRWPDARYVCLVQIKVITVSMFLLTMKSVIMDIVVDNVPPKFGMLMSRSWIKILGGTL
jgi:hypothetical protein